MKKIIFIVLLFSFMSGCISITRYYKSKKLRKTHTKIYLTVNKLSKSMNKDLKKRKSIVNSLNLQYNNLLYKRVPELKPILKNMSETIKKVEKQDVIALNLKNRVFELTKNRKNIRADKPEWDKYSKLKDRTKILESKIENLNEHYRDLSDKYNKLIKKANVKEVSSINIRKSFKMNSNKLRNSVSKIRNKVDILLKRYSNSKEKSDNLDKVKVLLSKIDKYWIEADRLIKLFEKRLNGKKKIYIIEDADNITYQIKNIYVKINRLGQEINKISKKL